jgi:hypothetical protein
MPTFHLIADVGWAARDSGAAWAAPEPFAGGQARFAPPRQRYILSLPAGQEILGVKAGPRASDGSTLGTARHTRGRRETGDLPARRRWPKPVATNFRRPRGWTSGKGGKPWDRNVETSVGGDYSGFRVPSLPQADRVRRFRKSKPRVSSWRVGSRPLHRLRAGWGFSRS